MGLLTIFVGIRDYENTENFRSKILQETENVEEVTIHFAELTQSDRWDFQNLIPQADTKYVTFYSDQVQIQSTDLTKLVNILQEAEGAFYQQRIQILTPEPKNQQHQYLYFPSFIFDKNELNDLNLDEIPSHLLEEKILLDFTDHFGSAVILKEAILCTTDIMENNSNLYELAFCKSWYQEDLEEFLLPYIREKKTMGKDLQKRVFSDVVLRFFMNLNDKNKFVLEPDEVDRFFAVAREISQYIDDDVIALRKEYRKMPTSFTYLFLYEKHAGELDLSVKHEGNNDRYFINDQWLETNFVDIRIEAINYENHQLTFYCEIRGDFFLQDPEKDIHVLINGNEIDHESYESYNLIKVFGRSVLRFHKFKFSLSEEEMDGGVTIEFYADIRDGNRIHAPLEFTKTSSRLIDTKYSYYTFGNHILTQDGRNLVITREKTSQVFYRECGMFLLALRKIDNEDEKRGITSLRLQYWQTKRKYDQKKVWIFYDKLYKAGDNAEYLFDYCIEHAEYADCYYIITKESADYSRLKDKYGNHILEYETNRQRLLVLHADIIFATEPGVWKYCGFSGNYATHFRNLLKAKVACIQHGLTIQNIAQYQNKLADNTDLYFCASKYEIDNLQKPIYGYEGDELKLTGSPRYDGLIDHDKRQILITPTWRRNIVVQGNRTGTTKQYNPHFKSTEYFAIYNRLINDPRLIHAAKKYNYKLLYLLHPTISEQIEDFDTNDSLTIVQATSDVSYEKVLTESSLMLTDYSGVQFDFAYMKKPVLYYQPKELPPQYEETVYQYSTMGFGPIITQYEDIISELCCYMENGCQMKVQYQERVDDFFAYKDHDNCKRIYELVDHCDQ